MEKLFYESRPYLFLALSFYALKSGHDSTLMSCSATLLLAISILVISARLKNRGVLKS
jgi:hypothetical protein